MAARTHVVDSGGTSRLVSRMFVIDSGGTARRILRAFVIDSGGTARLIFQGDVVNLTTVSLSDLAISPANATTSYSLNNNGTATTTGSGSGATTWLTPSSSAGNYEARMTVSSGSFTSGAATGSWLNLGTSRFWTLTESTNGNSSLNVTGTIEIRRVSDSVVVASASVDMTSTVEV